MKRISTIALSLVFLFGGVLTGIGQTKDQKISASPTPAKSPVTTATVAKTTTAQTKPTTSKRVRNKPAKKKQPNYEYLAYLEAKKTRESQERMELDMAKIKESEDKSVGILNEAKTMLTDFTGFAKPLLTKIDSAVTSISAWTGYTYNVAWWFVAVLAFIAFGLLIYGAIRGIRWLLAWNERREPIFARRGLKIT